MEILKIDDKNQHVFTLRRGDNKMVYIPVEHLDKTDFGRLYELEKRVTKSNDLLTLMRDEELNNGRSAVLHFSKVIRLATFTDSDINEVNEKGEPVVESEDPAPMTQTSYSNMDELFELRAKIEELEKNSERVEGKIDKAEARRKPGPKPKTPKE